MRLYNQPIKWIKEKDSVLHVDQLQSEKNKNKGANAAKPKNFASENITNNFESSLPQSCRTS